MQKQAKLETDANSSNVRAYFEERKRALAAALPSNPRRVILNALSTVFPGWFAEQALAQLTTPRRFTRPASEAVYLKAAKSFELPSGLRAWAWGSGPPVLLVHGWEGRGSQLGGFVAPLLAGGFRVLTFDASAHGESPGKRASVADFAAAILAIQRHEGPLHAVIAHSLGGPAVSLALQKELLVDALAYISCPADLNLDAPLLAQKSGLSRRAVERMKRQLPRRVNVTFEQLDVVRYGAGMKRPLYVVHDSEDKDVPCGAAERYRQNWPGAVVRLTQGLGHRRILKDPDVIDAVTAYVRGVR